MKLLARKSLISLLVLTCFLFGICTFAWATESKTKVIATTSLIASLVKEIGKDKVEVSTIIPPASCPGHFDLKIQDVKFLNEARGVFYHGWEAFMPKLVQAIPAKEAALKQIKVPGNWMVPDLQKKAALAIAKELGKLDPKNKAFYETNAQTYNKKVEQTVAKIKNKAAKKIAGQPVVCSALQKDLLGWLGCKVVGVYGRAEDLTPQKTVQMIQAGKKAQARIVIDNLQSGPGAGKVIAKELGVKEVTLTNFPGGLPGTETYLKALEKNVNLILANWK